MDLLLKRTADESGGGEASSAAAAAVSAAAAATKAASAEAAEEAASIAEAAAARDITWRVRDAVESTFAQGWEARRSGGGGVSGGVVKAASASARPQSAPAAVAAAAATPTLTPTAPPAPPPSASSFTPLPPSTAIATTSVITVEFVVRCQDASYGERVWISGGGAAALGSWRPERALRRGGASRAGGADAAGRRGCGCSGLGGNGIIGAEGERLIGRAGARESSLSPPPPPATSDASRALSIHARPNPIAPARAEGCPAAARRAQRRASPNEGLALHGFCRGGSAVQETEGVPLVLALSRGGAESLSRARACGLTSRCALGSQVC